MQSFTAKVYYPLLDFVPKEWLEDFQHIILRFDPAEHSVKANLRANVFHINVDLKQMTEITMKQLKQKDNNFMVNDRILMQYFGNIAYVIVETFFNYNKDRHPTLIEGKNPQEITKEFMVNVAKREHKNYKKPEEYII